VVPHGRHSGHRHQHLQAVCGRRSQGYRDLCERSVQRQLHPADHRRAL